MTQPANLSMHTQLHTQHHTLIRVSFMLRLTAFLPSCDCSCCPTAIPATMWLFLPQCGYSCCHAAINCCHVDIFLLQCSYSHHHEAILAAMQLFLPPRGYSCFPAAVILAIYVALLASIPSDCTI